MRQYEAVYILDPALEEAELNALAERFQSLVTDNGGSIQHVDRWERRRLAYEIKGRREGFYIVMNFQGAPAVEAELTRVFRITDGVLRSMIVRMDEKLAEKSIAEAKAAAEAKAKAAAAAAIAEAAAAAEAATLEAAALEAAAAAEAARQAEPEEAQEEDVAEEEEEEVDATEAESDD